MLTKHTLLTIHLLYFNPCRSVRRSRPIFYHLYCNCINHPSSGVDSPGYARFSWHKCKDNDDKGLFQVLGPGNVVCKFYHYPVDYKQKYV